MAVTSEPTGAKVDRAVPPPARRPLKVYAFDPMLGVSARNRVTVDVVNEPLRPGPSGSRVQVIDYDSTNGRLYPAVDLDDRNILMQGGLDPAEADPSFHQQMVYAVVMRVVENFERALGRRWSFSGAAPLRVFPHAMQDRNAYYDPVLRALLFGYFRADDHDIGANLPGQTVFTCLSHDIVAHETTHAMVHRMRPYLLEPTNADVLAFHEGFADIVAILQHFSLESVVEHGLGGARGDLRQTSALLDLADQFGYATGRGGPLRSAIEHPNASGASYQDTEEPHDRGAFLVAAVFSAFISTYEARVADLIRIATGGSGVLPQGALHPDLVGRLASEAAKTAQNVLTMCIRAFEYLPPVDVTFGDYLRALVTSDSDAVPDDPLEQRNALIEGFRQRGIFPAGITSLAVESLRWPSRTVSEPMAALDIRGRLFMSASAYEDGAAIDVGQGTWAEEARALHAFADRHREELDLHPTLPIAVRGFHVSQGWTRDQRFVANAVVQFVQTVPPESVPDRDGLPLRGGTTVIAGPDGQVRYVISKPLPADIEVPAAHVQDAPAPGPREERQRDTMRQLHRGLL